MPFQTACAAGAASRGRTTAGRQGGYRASASAYDRTRPASDNEPSRCAIEPSRSKARPTPTGEGDGPCPRHGPGLLSFLSRTVDGHALEYARSARGVRLSGPGPERDKGTASVGSVPGPVERPRRSNVRRCRAARGGSDKQPIDLEGVRDGFKLLRRVGLK